MTLLEAHQPVAARQAFKRLSVAPLSYQRPALCIEERPEFAVGQVYEAAGAIAHDAGGEPVPAVGDGGEPPVGRDAEAGDPAESRFKQIA